MPSYDKTRNIEDTRGVNLEKTADILQATFKHYYEMAMDHHTKAATTSNILLIAVGAILGFVTLDKQIAGAVDFISGLAVFTLGVFGVTWSLKQHERYHYWEHIAYEYQKELAKIVPMLKTADNYQIGAKQKTTSMFGPFFANLHDRHLWAFLHVFVAMIGLGLMIFSV